MEAAPVRVWVAGQCLPARLAFPFQVPRSHLALKREERGAMKAVELLQEAEPTAVPLLLQGGRMEK